MAITAAITLDDATTVPGQRSNATCTVTNSGGSAVNVVAIVPKATPNGGTSTAVSVACGAVMILPGINTSVAGSNGTRALPFAVTAFAPQPGSSSSNPNPANPNSFVYDIGATVYTDDGAITAATTTTLTVTAATH